MSARRSTGSAQRSCFGAMSAFSACPCLSTAVSAYLSLGPVPFGFSFRAGVHKDIFKRVSNHSAQAKRRSLHKGLGA